MPFDPAAASRLLEKKLAAIARKSVLPAGMLALVADTARAQLADRVAHPAPVVETALEDIEKVLRGAPMLARRDFPLDVARGEALFAAVARLVRDSEPHLGEAMAILKGELERGALVLAEAFVRYRDGDDAFLAGFGAKTPQAPRLLGFLVQAALTPQFAAVGEAVYAHFPAERTWSFGQCPVCGSPPLMARLAGKAGARQLTCSFCQVEYRAKRLLCPFCGEEDAKMLEVFTAPDEPGYTVNVCQRCKGYIKTADFRELDRPSLPVLDDLESLTLDLAARNRGLHRPVLSAWGF